MVFVPFVVKENYIKRSAELKYLQELRPSVLIEVNMVCFRR